MKQTHLIDFCVYVFIIHQIYLSSYLYERQ